MRLPALLGTAVAASAALAACGLGPGATPGGVSLTVTRNFGAVHLPAPKPLKVRGEETVMSLLSRNFTVKTEYGGGFVESIDGHAGKPQASPPVAWFYYVNGVLAPKGAAATDVHQGDRVWWDLHRWGGTEGTPAVVGSFPQPFLSGIDGKRFPVRVECAPAAQSACHAVAASLQRHSVPAALAGASEGAKPDTLRILVGTASELSYEGVMRSLAAGPASSGVFARLTPTSLTALNENGTTAHVYGPGSGLIAATAQGSEPPVWIVSGTDAAGTERAARQFDEAALKDHFALAVTPAGPEPLPVAGN